MIDAPIGLVPADATGAETLATMAHAERYNRWQFDRIEPFLGTRLCEIGSGIGNLSRHFASRPHELLLLTDTDEYYLNRLRLEFASDPSVLVQALHLPDDTAAVRFGSLSIDTVIASNVFEHIADDFASLVSVRRLLRPKGRLVVLVPAGPTLYGSLDEELGHYRRYTKTVLTKLFSRANLRVEYAAYFNLVGCVGWWFNARLLKRRRIPLSQLRAFDKLVPLLRAEDWVTLPAGQSLIVVGRA